MYTSSYCLVLEIKKTRVKESRLAQAPSTVIVIFGASGDLASRKLLPALFEIYRTKVFPQPFAVLGVGRSKLSTPEFRQRIFNRLTESKSELAAGDNSEELKQFSQILHYASFNTLSIAAYGVLPDALAEITAGSEVAPNFLYYFSTPPSLYPVIAESLSKYGLARPTADTGWRRLVVEKPFGQDLASARELNDRLLREFNEEQIFRIDHYLGKETVQNILVTRLANGLFEPVWNNRHIHHVEVTCFESIGLEGRAGYYDGIGALRDMLQNHMLQLLGFLALEPPKSLDSGAIRREMLRVFQAIRIPASDKIEQHFVRAQYLSGSNDGQNVKGYLEEEGVSAISTTETFVAAKLFIDNDRWKGVPFFLRTGKRLTEKVSEVAIHFKPACGSIIEKRVAASDICNRVLCDSCNQLVLRIQPDEGVLLRFGMKRPGDGFKAKSVDMTFHYSSLGEVKLRRAYERLLIDCLTGDAMLFPQGESVLRCWEIVEPVRAFWESNPSSIMCRYKAGTWGPREAENLIDCEEMMWRYPSSKLEGCIH